MEQYINKSALVAEIEKLENKNCKNSNDFNLGVSTYLGILKHFVNTLEVKEVDLEKAIDDYIYTHDGRKRLDLELNWKYCNLTLKGGDKIIKFAKHFFELGMSVSNKVQSLESVLDRIDNKIERCIYNNGRKIDYENVVMMISKEIKNIRQELKAQKGE